MIVAAIIARTGFLQLIRTLARAVPITMVDRNSYRCHITISLNTARVMTHDSCRDSRLLRLDNARLAGEIEHILMCL